MTRRDDPRLFYGPPVPLDDRPVSRPGATFAAEGQARDTLGRYQEQSRDSHTQKRYRGETLTPEYRRYILGYSPRGRQILKDEDEAQSRDDQGRYQSHAAGAPPASAGGAGAQVVTNEYQRQGLVYKELYRQVLKDEDAVSRIVADSRT